MPWRRARLPQWCANFGVGTLAATHRRHEQLVAPAGTAVDLVAVAEFQVLAHADADLAQPGAAAGHRNRRARQSGVALDESLLDLVRRYGQRRLGGRVALGDFHRLTGLSDQVEVSRRFKARAGAVLIPLVIDQPRRSEERRV